MDHLAMLSNAPLSVPPTNDPPLTPPLPPTPSTKPDISQSRKSPSRERERERKPSTGTTADANGAPRERKPSASREREHTKPEEPVEHPPLPVPSQPAREPSWDNTWNKAPQDTAQSDSKETTFSEAVQESSTKRPPLGPPSKSAPAVENAATQPPPGPAGSVVGPPPVKELKIKEKAEPLRQKVVKMVEQKPKSKQLEKAKDVSKRLSKMNDVEILSELKRVVRSENPLHLYKKLKKVGQG